jgi:ribosomal-protein-alanine N-acetyltransferase
MMELQTKRLLLREFLPDDFAAVREYESREETYRYEKPLACDAGVRAYIDQSIAWTQENPRTHYRLALTIPPDLTARGRISLAQTFAEIREWEIGWTVDWRCWGQGYATEGALMMLEFAFTTLGAHRVVAFCNTMNKASVRVMQKIGMAQDGHLRQTLWWNGGWMDELLYSILESDWNQMKPATPTT